MWYACASRGMIIMFAALLLSAPRPVAAIGFEDALRLGVERSPALTAVAARTESARDLARGFVQIGRDDLGGAMVQSDRHREETDRTGTDDRDARAADATRTFDGVPCDGGGFRERTEAEIHAVR